MVRMAPLVTAIADNPRSCDRSQASAQDPGAEQRQAGLRQACAVNEHRQLRADRQSHIGAHQWAEGDGEGVSECITIYWSGSPLTPE